MTPSFEIKTANAADAALIADMTRRTFYDSFAAQNTEANMTEYMETQLTPEKLMAEVTAPGNIFLLAILHKRPVGFARLMDHAGPPAMGEGPGLEIVRIYVEKDAIGTGAGSALMQAAIDVARERKKKWVWLGVWEHNHRAIGFYTRWGFEKFGDHPFVVGKDVQKDWWMKKRL